MTISFLENWHSLYLLQISSESLKPFYRSLQISVLTVKTQPSAWLHFYPRLLLFHPQLTSQDHTPQVIRRALEKHNMEDFSCHDFSLCQTLKCGKGSLSRVNLHTNIDLTKREKNSIFFPRSFTCFLFIPQSSRSQIKPTYFTLCVPPPTMTLCSVSDGEAIGGVLAPLPALEMQPGTSLPSEKCLCMLNIRTAQSSSSASAEQ